jgi:hypothetical protein
MMKHLLLATLLISFSVLSFANEGKHQFKNAVWIIHPNGGEMVCFEVGELLSCSFQKHLRDASWFKCISGVEANSLFIIYEPGV